MDKKSIKLSPNMSITYLQSKVIEKMESEKWYSAYDLKVSLNTLNGLLNKGFLETKSDKGSLFFPRNQIQFKLNDQGQRLKDHLKD